MHKLKYILIYILISGTLSAGHIDLNKLSIEQKENIYYILKAIDSEAQNKTIYISKGTDKPKKHNIEKLTLILNRSINITDYPKENWLLGHLKSLGKGSKMKVRQLKGFKFNTMSSITGLRILKFKCDAIYIGKSAVGPFIFPSNKIIIKNPCIQIF